MKELPSELEKPIHCKNRAFFQWALCEEKCKTLTVDSFFPDVPEKPISYKFKESPWWKWITMKQMCDASKGSAFTLLNTFKSHLLDQRVIPVTFIDFFISQKSAPLFF